MRGLSRIPQAIAQVFTVFVCFLFVAEEADAQAVALPWGESVQVPEMGFNTRLRRHHEEPGCAQPEPSVWRYDWNHPDMRDDVARFGGGVMRYPGGTMGNYWNWVDETRFLIGEDGEPVTLDICEASFIPKSNSISIGCPGPNEDMTPERFEEVKIKTTITLSSFLEGVQNLKNRGLDVKELYMISLIDPFLYVGSPQVEYLLGEDATPQAVRNLLSNNSIQRANAQLDKLLFEYCGDCETYAGPLDIELGNEYYLRRYGKFFPRNECFETNDLCSDCVTDVDMYADICSELLPGIRERFPNARVAVHGGHSTAGYPWNPTLAERFGASSDEPMDAAVIHFYPRSISENNLDLAFCLCDDDAYDLNAVQRRQQLSTQEHYVRNDFESLRGSGLPIWITEFNNFDYSEECYYAYSDQFDAEDSFPYDSGNWLHAVSIFNIFNSFVGFMSAGDDPWMDTSKDMPIEMITMQVLYGNDRVAVLRRDRKISASGLAYKTIMDASQDAESIQRLMIAPRSSVNISPGGEWTSTITDDEILSYHEDFFYDFGLGPQSVSTFLNYGWIFEGPNGPKGVIMNLQNEELIVDMRTVQGFDDQTTYDSYSVAPDAATEVLTEEWASPIFNHSSGDVNSQYVTIPALSMTIVTPGPPSGPTSIAEAAQDLAFKLYPNPSEGLIQIELQDTPNSMVLVDMTGRLVQQWNTLDWETSHQLDIRHLNKGTYFLSAERMGITSTQRITLTH